MKTTRCTYCGHLMTEAEARRASMEGCPECGQTNTVEDRESHCS